MPANLNIKGHLVNDSIRARSAVDVSCTGITVALETVCKMQSTAASVDDTLPSIVDTKFRGNAPRRCSDTLNWVSSILDVNVRRF